MADKDKIIKYLNKAYEITKIKDKLEREYEQKQKEVGAINVSYNEIKSNNNKSKVENKAIELIKLKKDIELYNIKIIEVKKNTACVIDKLEDETLKSLLRLRYLEFKKWKDIMYILHYSEQHIHRLHNKVLKEIDKIIKDVSVC